MPPAEHAGGELSDYYLAGRKLGLLRCTASLTATTLSASATLVAADLIASRGLVGIWFNLAGGLGLILLGLFLAPRIRAFPSLTFASLLGDLFGDPWIRKTVSVICVAAAISWLALLTHATRMLAAAVLPGAPGQTLAGLLILAVLVYTALGGQRAVAGSDVIQLGVVILGFAALLVHLWPDSSASWSFLPAGHRSFPLAPGFGAGTLTVWALLYGLPHMVGPDIYSRVLSASSEGVARKACILSGVAKILFGLLLAAIVLSWTAAAPPASAATGRDGTIIGIVSGALPFPLDLLVLLALLMAFLSSLDTVLLTSSSILAHDLLAPALLHRRASDPAGGGNTTGAAWPGSLADSKGELRLARVGSVALLGTAVALAVGTDLTAVGWFGLGFALFAGSVGPAVLITLLAGPARPSRMMVRAAIGAGLLGVVAAHLFQISTGTGSTGDLVIPGVVASTAFMLGGLVTTRRHRPSGAATPSDRTS